MRPLENTAPTKTPTPATAKMVRIEIALDPIAEFKKFTASLLTPTTRSAMARTNKITMIDVYKTSTRKINPQKSDFGK